MTEEKEYVKGRYNLVINEDNELEYIQDFENHEDIPIERLEDLLNEQDKDIKYWKQNTMILLSQVRRLLPRMTEKEIMEYEKELERIER